MNADPAKRDIMMADAAMKDGEAVMQGAAMAKRHMMMGMSKEMMEDEGMMEKREQESKSEHYE
jgi:hypothetical protein